MILFVAVFLVVATVTAILFSIKRPKDFTFKLWGMVTMYVYAPVLTWLVGISYAAKVGDGFAGVAVFIVMGPVLFVAGIILYFIGMRYS